MLTWQQNENWAHPINGCALLFFIVSRIELDLLVFQANHLYDDIDHVYLSNTIVYEC